MSKRSDSPEFNPHFPASDNDSDNSKDVNLNSKKFADCNLIETENTNKNGECDKNKETPTKINSVRQCNIEFDGSEKSEMIIQNEESDFALNNIVDSEDSVHLLDGRKNPAPGTNYSTPKPESVGSQALRTSFSISLDSSAEPDVGTQTYLVAKGALSESDILTNEEIYKKFQEFSFAFRTDSMTIPKRLYLMKRRRDQAENNIENELTIIKTKLETLQYLGLNSEYVHLINDLKKQLDFVLNAVLQLSSSAENYGYIQHEEKFLEFGSTMVQHVEKIESLKTNSFKSSEKSKAESKRSQAPISPDVEGDEDRMLRRRSVASVTVESNSRRRASIATLPRMGHAASDNGYSGKGFQWTPARPAGIVVKKLSFSQASSRTNTNNAPIVEDSRKDLNSGRHRKESRNSEGSMKNIEEFPERRSTIESEELLLQELPALNDSNADASDSSLQLKQLFETMEEIRCSSNSQGHIAAIYWLRQIIEWNKLLINSTRFRWPETGLQYVPFYITWYVVFVLVFVFIGGFFIGINGCYVYSCLKYSALWFVVPAFFNFLRRFYRFLLPLLFIFFLALIFTFLWLTEVLLPQLRNEEIDALFKTFKLEVRYLYGPPPV